MAAVGAAEAIAATAGAATAGTATAAKAKAGKVVAPTIATRAGLVDANSGPWQLAFDEKTGFLTSLVQGNREWLHNGGGQQQPLSLPRVI